MFEKTICHWNWYFVSVVDLPLFRDGGRSENRGGGRRVAIGRHNLPSRPPGWDKVNCSAKILGLCPPAPGSVIPAICLPFIRKRGSFQLSRAVCPSTIWINPEIYQGTTTDITKCDCVKALFLLTAPASFKVNFYRKQLFKCLRI